MEYLEYLWYGFITALPIIAVIVVMTFLVIAFVHKFIIGDTFKSLFADLWDVIITLPLIIGFGILWILLNLGIPITLVLLIIMLWSE